MFFRFTQQFSFALRLTMQTARPDTRRITHHGSSAPKAMSIQQYVELVDRLFEKEEFSPAVKKSPQPAR
jgi:hypothetical protein